MSHPHGCVSWNVLGRTIFIWKTVTPSRVCELKCPCHYYTCAWFRHTLTGVWVEIKAFAGLVKEYESHPHGCVSWNFWDFPKRLMQESHPHGCVSWNWTKRTWGIWLWSHPHGCVSWNRDMIDGLLNRIVTPSRVCELKWYDYKAIKDCQCHTLTGVWVEMQLIYINCIS